MRFRPRFLALPAIALALFACEREASTSGGTTTTAMDSQSAPIGYTAAAPVAPPAPPGAASLGFGAVGRAASRSSPVITEQSVNSPANGLVAESADAAVTQARSGDAATRAAAGMVIRSGQATVQVDSLDLAVARVRQLAERVGGTIANSSLQSGREQVRAATLEIRVAAPRFDELVAGLSPFGKVETVNVTAEDVGEEFVDLSARVANARRLEARLIELLATRTGKLSDVLTVERELARVREEIERYEGRLRFLQARSAVSTLAVTVHEPYPILAGAPATNPIAQAFLQAWRNFVALLAVVIASLGVVVPLAALGVLAWLGVRRLRPVIVKPTT